MGLIGAALGAAGSIFGGIQASKAMKNAKKEIEKGRQRNKDWYDRRYNEDATQRADAQAILTRTQEEIRARNRAAEGARAVTGGSEESVAATKAANAGALADVASQIAANGERHKDAIENQYIATDNQYQQQLTNIETGRANALAQATGAFAEAAGDMDFGEINFGKTKDGKPKNTLSL